MMEKTIEISGQKVKFKSSASVPRLYRLKFGRDIFVDMNKLQNSFVNNGSPDGSTMEIDDLEMFENIAYIMAYSADHTIPEEINEWLDNFDMFSIYEILPELIELWGANFATQATPKKKEDPPNAK